nr:40s ribosomal protein s29 [Quercus suber]
MRNWMLPRFPDNYRRKRDSDEREYYAGLLREWDFHVNESNALHDDLVQLVAPLVNRSSVTLPWQNMHQYERAVTKIKKENNLIILRRSRYHMLQLIKELAIATNRQLTPTERNNVLSYEDYLTGHSNAGNSHPKSYGPGSRTCRMCGNPHGLIRKCGLMCCRQCFCSNAKEISFKYR